MDRILYGRVGIVAVMIFRFMFVVLLWVAGILEGNYLGCKIDEGKQYTKMTVSTTIHPNQHDYTPCEGGGDRAYSQQTKSISLPTHTTLHKLKIDTSDRSCPANTADTILLITT